MTFKEQSKTTPLLRCKSNPPLIIDAYEVLGHIEDLKNIPYNEKLTSWYGDYDMYETRHGVTDEQVFKKISEHTGLKIVDLDSLYKSLDLIKIEPCSQKASIKEKLSNINNSRKEPEKQSKDFSKVKTEVHAEK